MGTGIETILAFVLFDVSVDDATDVVFVFFHFFEQAVVLFVLLDFLVFDFLDGGVFALHHTHAGLGVLGFFLDGFFLGLVVARLDCGLALHGLDDGFFVLRRLLFGLFFLGLGHLRLGFGRFGLARTPLLVQGLGLEGEMALRAFDGPLGEIVEAHAAARADALRAKIRFDQCNIPVRFRRAGHLPRLARSVKGPWRAPSRPTTKKLGLTAAAVGLGNLPRTPEELWMPQARPLTGRHSPALRGMATVPGDKSISHRALILGGMALGETRITGLLEAEDVLNTAHAVRAFGAQVVRQGPGAWKVNGTGVGGWRRPEDVLDFGNSGTGSRLMMGSMATSPVTAVFTGDSSLRKRPMGRVLEPLRLFGAEYDARPGGLMPVTLHGAGQAICADYTVPMASAQVKSAMLLAALNAPGRSTISQNVLTRDHTERMLAAFGAEIGIEPLPSGGESIVVMGEAELKAVSVAVPRDPSSAAFPMVAALVVPGSDILLKHVLLNPRRTGLFDTLTEMGAHIEVRDEHEAGGERVGDVVVRASALKGTKVPPERVPSMIDEFPALAVAAAFAEGPTVMRGLDELRVKESDRLAAIIAGLRAGGIVVQELEDGMVVEGRGGDGVPGGGTVATRMDHRIAMAFLVMGLASREAVTVDDSAMIATSFPDFESLMGGLGAVFEG